MKKSIIILITFISLMSCIAPTEVKQDEEKQIVKTETFNIVLDIYGELEKVIVNDELIPFNTSNDYTNIVIKLTKTVNYLDIVITSKGSTRIQVSNSLNSMEFSSLAPIMNNETTFNDYNNIIIETY